MLNKYDVLWINKFGDKAIVENELNMNGNSIVGLPTHIGALTGDGDAVSRRILLDVIEKLNHISLKTNGTNKMTGDLLMDSSDNDSVSIGCIDFGAGEKSFGVYLGNVLYNTLVDSQPVTLYASDGFLVKVNNVNVTKFNSNKVDLFTSIDAKQNFIYNVPQPIHPYDVCKVK